MTIVLAGGSGFIGTGLARKLLALGDTVIVVDVAAPKFTHERLYFIQCDITAQQLPFNVLEQTDAVINLVGASTSHIGSEAYRQIIRDSRIVSTRHIVESMLAATNRPTILINASSVGYYGERGDEELTEKSSKGVGFLADTVSDWEAEAQKAEIFGTRVVCVRTAPVIGQIGLFPRLRKSTRMGILFRLSKRDFWQPWIHEEDIINTYLFALQTSTLQGSVNAVAPEIITHGAFITTLGKALKRKSAGALPGFLKHIFFGRLPAELTESERVSPQRILDKGFIFTYPTLDLAVKATLKKNEKN